jgi:hypothetical protein
MYIGISRCFRFSTRGLAFLLICLASMAPVQPASAQSVSTGSSVSSAQNVANTLSSLTSSAISRLVSKYTAMSYSVLGVYTLKKVTTTELTFEAYPEKPKGTTFSLVGKNVKVKTENEGESSSSSLQAGQKVLICVKDKEVIIFLITTKSSSSSTR